jgi:TonB family protein
MKKSILMLIFLAECNFAYSQPNITQSVVRPKISTKCDKPMWPHSSLKNGDDGALQIVVKVGEDGKATQSIIQFSSGFPDLDIAAQESVRKCGFTPGTVNGQQVPMSTVITYFWLDTSSDSPGPNWQKILAAARDGDTGAIYVIAALQISNVATKASGIELLKIAADKGSASAQYELAFLYESGDGLAKNQDLAEQWYSKAVANGNVLAIERALLMHN